MIEKDLRMFLNLEKNKDKFGKMFYFGSGAEYDKTKPIVQVKETDIGKSISNSCPTAHSAILQKSSIQR